MTDEQNAVEVPPPRRPAARRRAQVRPQSPRRSILVTGFPGFIGRRLVARLLSDEPESRMVLLVHERSVDAAQSALTELPPAQAKRASILVGDVTAMHLGLTADEVRMLVREVTDIYHLAAISALGAPEELLYRVNVVGTVNALELASLAERLTRFNHVSSCFVSGDREGVVAEDELEAGQGFQNPYQRTKYEAERKARAAMDRLPVSIYRPAIVVGDSQTGEVSRFDGPYYLGILLLSSPVAVPLPLPDRGGAPFNIIPVDYAVAAIAALSRHPEAVSKTFHLVDPNPKSVRVAYELIARAAGIAPGKISVGTLPRSLFAGLNRLLGFLPGLEHLNRARQAIGAIDTMTVYTSPNTRALLAGSGIECPPFETYVENLVAYVRAHYNEQRRREIEEDPLV